ADVQRWAQPDNPPLYVSEVKYGRVLLVSFTAADSSEQIKIAINAVYSAGEGNLSAEIKEKMSNMSINVLSVGSTGDAALGPLQARTPQDLAPALQAYIRQGIQFSMDNPGAPVALTMRYVGSRAGGGPFAVATAQMVTDNSPEVVSLTSTEVCHPDFKVWD